MTERGSCEKLRDQPFSIAVSENFQPASSCSPGSCDGV
jgi:hypothetical protein